MIRYSPTTQESTMLLKYYRVRAINPDLVQVFTSQGTAAYWDIGANSIESAWRKFVTQRFGILKPNPSDYDIRLESIKSV
jgi:hypothetical protein